MFNKKGGAPSDEILGVLIFMLGTSLLLIPFFIYLKVDDKKESDEFRISTKEFDIIEDINFLFEIPVDQNKKVADLIRESYLSNNYDEFERITREFLDNKYNNWILGIYDSEGFTLFEMKNFNIPSEDTTIVTEREIFVQNRNTKKIEKIRIAIVTN